MVREKDRLHAAVRIFDMNSGEATTLKHRAAGMSPAARADTAGGTVAGVHSDRGAEEKHDEADGERWPGLSGPRRCWFRFDRHAHALIAIVKPDPELAARSLVATLGGEVQPVVGGIQEVDPPFVR